MKISNILPLTFLVFLVMWVYYPLFFINLPVQDECHFFDPVYELFKSGRWAAPYDFYLGGGMEKTAYGHPPTNGLMHSIIYGLTKDGFLSVRLTAFLSKLIGSIILFLILRKENVKSILIIVSIALFTLHNYSVLNISRPDYFAGFSLFLFTYTFRKEKYLLSAIFWGIAFSFHQIMGIVGIAFYLVNIFHLLKGKITKNIFLNKQIWVAPLAAIFGILIWVIPILIFNGFRGITEMYNGTLHHLNLVDRNIEWYTNNVGALIFDQLPYFILIILGPFLFMFLDKYTKALYLTIVAAFIFVALKTVNTSWYYYMFAPLYVYVFAMIINKVYEQVKQKNLYIKVSFYILSLVLIGFILRIRHTTVFLKNPIDAFYNKNNYKNHLKDIVYNLPNESRVLSSPQLYHFVRPHFKESFDIEQFGTYALPGEINKFDYLLLVEEHTNKGPLHRLNASMIEILEENFTLVYEDIYEPNKIRGVQITIPPFRIYKNTTKN